MDFGKKKERQTGIIDDETAIAMAQQGKKNGGKGKGKQKQSGFKLSDAQDAGVSKPKPAPRNKKNSKPKLAAAPSAKSHSRFYEEGGLRIPLYDQKGKKKTNARDGRSLAQKTSKADLLKIVKEYAGGAKAEEFRNANASRNQIGAWVQYVETQALGKGPANEKEREKADPAANTKPIALDAAEQNSKRKRDNEQAPTLPQQTAKKQKFEVRDAKEGEPIASHGNARYHQKKKKIFKPQGTKDEEASLQFLTSIMIDYLTNEQDDMASTASRSATAPPKIDNKHLMKEHPLIPALELNPSHNHRNPLSPPSTQILHQPAQRCHIILTASSDTAVHETTIPYRKDRNAAPYFKNKLKSDSPTAPYLKPGKHGWDHENHRWGFQGDPDLLTGVGHQVDPRDAERLKREQKNGKDVAWYAEKYPGRLGNQYPCGCQLPWDDEDSEEE
ncbi:hypothetical protein BU26DRAFT_608686 [Trematosphaeria pertusa]|uniref:Uncharacterized protein n=1 Tax=Trematosphaeria pertusa TaxID=390896 RepID=A0A6A6I3R0_9PLEO|nr:uncharacterized protein BU26DRAFT_608686 [Trematosphaeria pertusa]KAF2244230.1 hypothetical protein BU26DRAFT_608686 [Trematosphaeria pertusa]